MPDAALRVTLANGITVYVAEDKMLPLVNVLVFFRGGRYLEPAGKEGVGRADRHRVAHRRRGRLDPKQLDEELDFLAAQLSTSWGRHRQGQPEPARQGPRPRASLC